MSKFTEAELEYLKTQRIGRLATINQRAEPQVTPVTFRYNAERDTLDIGGPDNSKSQKFRNIARNSLASFVVDDRTPQGGVASRYVHTQRSLLKGDKLFSRILARS